jgi:aminopeptidase
VRSTKPLLVNGRVATPLRMRFEGARPVEIDADSGAEVSRELAPRHDGAARLGEVALVDGSGRIGLDTLFHETLLDTTRRATSRSAAPLGSSPRTRNQPTGST